MNSAEQARTIVRDALNAAAASWGSEALESRPSWKPQTLIKAIMDAQGHHKVPAALDEYWRLAGARDGLWQEFARCGGFSANEALSARMLAIETALASGSDWHTFRYGEPVLVFQFLAGGEALWVECDSDAREIDHDPPVWLLTEEPGKGPQLVADSFSEYLQKMIDSETRIRKPLG